MLEYNNVISVKEYCELRSAVEWQPIIEEQAQAGLNNSDFVIAYDKTGISKSRDLKDGQMEAMVQVCRCGGQVMTINLNAEELQR